MNEEHIKPITDPAEIPEGLSDEEQLAYWKTHGLTEEFFDKTEEVPENERPSPRGGRTLPVSVRFDPHTLNRLKGLAGYRDIGYQTLLKQFVAERLYEEEKKLESQRVLQSMMPITMPDDVDKEKLYIRADALVGEPPSEITEQRAKRSMRVHKTRWHVVSGQGETEAQ